jgi:GT2 family glycosyltransferase
MSSTQQVPARVPSLCIAVCTFNRADSLRALLGAVAAMERPQHWSVELVVVDNGSKDQTQDVFRALAPQLPMPARILFEGTPGLSAARNAALRATVADAIVFTDDDCLPQPDWAVALCAGFDRLGGPGMLGGRVELFNPLDLPITINRSLVARRVDGPTMDLVSFMGCNLAFSRRVVESVGRFDELLGAGARFQSAEDWDYIYRALRAGFPILYCPEIVVFHNHGRRTLRERARLMRGYAIGAGALYFKHWRLGDGLGLRNFYWKVTVQLKAILVRPPKLQSRAECAHYLWYLARGFFSAAFNRKAWER